MAETVADQGSVWWPAGLAPQEQVRVVFNVALQNRPVRMTCEDFEIRTPMDIDVETIEQSGTRQWTRYTAATIRLPKPEQRGRSFRWRVYAAG